jgi:hypothetical protein
MRHHTKFDNHIQDKIQGYADTHPTGRYGVISSYDPLTNTATVLLTAPDSDLVQQIIPKVPCPVYHGIQNAGPQPGTLCWVSFLSAKNESRPIITHFFNHNYEGKDYYRHTDARTGVPQYMLSW